MCNSLFNGKPPFSNHFLTYQYLPTNHAFFNTLESNSFKSIESIISQFHKFNYNDLKIIQASNKPLLLIIDSAHEYSVQ